MAFLAALYGSRSRQAWQEAVPSFPLSQRSRAGDRHALNQSGVFRFVERGFQNHIPALACAAVCGRSAAETPPGARADRIRTPVTGIPAVDEDHRLAAPSLVRCIDHCLTVELHPARDGRTLTPWRCSSRIMTIPQAGPTTPPPGKKRFHRSPATTASHEPGARRQRRPGNFQPALLGIMAGTSVAAPDSYQFPEGSPRLATRPAGCGRRPLKLLSIKLPSRTNSFS